MCTYARDNGTHIEELWVVSRLVYLGLDVRVDSELEVACVWTVGSLNGCMLGGLGQHEGYLNKRSEMTICLDQANISCSTSEDT